MNFWRRLMLTIIYTATIVAMWLAVVQAGAAPLLGSQFADSNLGAVLFNSHDVPPGFELDATQSGSHEDAPVAPGWLSPLTKLVHIPGYDRVWLNRQDRHKIIALVRDYRIDKLASVNVYSAAQGFASEAKREFSIPAVPDARGFVVNYGELEAALGIFAHGSLSFAIAAVTPTTTSDADIELTRRLVTIQAAKTPVPIQNSGAGR
jgi:hypothetical protein